jgi:CRP-like cAMP-binding protein
MELNLLKEIIDANSELYLIFRGCPYEILSRWEINEYPAGTVICCQGDMMDCLYIIIEGYADVYYMAENGSKYSQAIIKKGQFIGEFEIFDQRPVICSVEALADLKLLHIKREFFMKWLEMDKNICFYLMKYANHQFYMFSEKAGVDTLYSLRARLCNYLLSCSGQAPKEGVGIKLKLNKEKLSEQFAVTKRSVNRILRSLQNKNIVDIKTDVIVIKDLEKLAQEENTSRFD